MNLSFGRDAFFVQQGGFDSHSDFFTTNNNKFTEMDAAMSRFVAEMKCQGVWEDVVVAQVSSSLYVNSRPYPYPYSTCNRILIFTPPHPRVVVLHPRPSSCPIRLSSSRQLRTRISCARPGPSPSLTSDLPHQPVPLPRCGAP